MERKESNVIKVDLAGVNSAEQLHVLLSQAFQFPDYYGRNWDAFEECIGEIECPEEIRIEGFKSLEARFPHDARLLIFILEDYVQTRAAHEVSLRVG